jgi:hypothetical protein
MTKPALVVRLSPNFTLDECQVTNQPFPNAAGPLERRNLERLCREFLEPVRARFGALRITSAFRSARVNEAIGGAKFSAHRWGLAADFQAIDGATPAEVVRWLADSGLEFDQAIDELNAAGVAWVHLGLATPVRPGVGPRRQALIKRRNSYARFPL